MIIFSALTTILLLLSIWVIYLVKFVGEVRIWHVMCPLLPLLFNLVGLALLLLILKWNPKWIYIILWERESKEA